MEPEPTKGHHFKGCWHAQALLSYLLPSVFPEMACRCDVAEGCSGLGCPSVVKHLLVWHAYKPEFLSSTVN